MSAKIYTLAELCETINRENFTRCELFEQSGQKATKSHAATEKPIKWLRGHITEWSKRPSTEAGYYFLYCYDSPNKKTKPIIYTLKIGNPPSLSEAPAAPAPIIIQQPAPAIENPLSWDSALKYQSEISSLKNEITRLSLENENLKNQLNDFESLEEGESESSGLLNENFLSGTIMPALNAFFDNQKQNRHLQFYGMAQKNPALWHTPLGMQILHEQGATAAPAMPKPRPMAKPASAVNFEAKNIQLCNEYFESLEPDDYSAIEEIKNNSENLQEFFSNLNQADPALYETLKAYVNAKGGRL